jgi:hypothetical protein
MGGQNTRLNILKKKIILGLKSIGIWSLDLKAMDERTKPSSLFIVANWIKK